jgi:hypothetical protein
MSDERLRAPFEALPCAQARSKLSAVLRTIWSILK